VILTRRQRNEIFERIAACGVDPASCELEDTAQGRQEDVLHRSTQSKFSIWHGNDQRPDFYHYSARLIVGGADFYQCMMVEWNTLMDYLEDWTNEVGYEINTPDLWAELRQVPKILKAAQSADASNEPFTLDERAVVWRLLDQARYAILREHHELTAEQGSAFEETLDEVKEAVTRVGRKDWVMLANGALLSLVVNDLVPPHVVQSAFNMLITGIAHIFGVGSPPPVIST
jgi:hypothetical protein